MRISLKLSLAIFSLSAAMAAAVYYIEGRDMQVEFTELQQQKAKDNLIRSKDTLTREVDHLDQFVQDWCNWDDTYQFVVDRNSSFIKSNLQDNLFEIVKVDLLFIINARGETVWGKCRLPDGTVLKNLEGFDSKQLALGTKQKPGPSLDKHSHTSGLLYSKSAPLIMTAYPILDSNKLKETRGTLVMGRFVSPKILEQLRSSSRADFDLYPVADVSKKPILATAMARLDSGRDFVDIPRSDRPVLGYSWLHGQKGEPTYMLVSRTTPDILQQGNKSLLYFQCTLLLIFSITTAAILLFVRQLVARPLELLVQKSNYVSATGDLTVSFGQGDRQDEIGELARGFSKMLHRLAELRVELMRSSRDAGMAEVARGVLHNAGNVMNSVTTATYQIDLIAERQRKETLQKLVDLLKQQADLGSFFASDPRSEQVIPYLEQFDADDRSDQSELQKEIDVLKANIRHMDEIIQSQHSFANKVKHQELTQIHSVVETAVGMLRDSFSKHGVQLRSNVREVPSVMTDPVRLSQVLVNFLTNAKDAVKHNPLVNRTIDVLVTHNVVNKQITISVTDNGIGLDPGQRERIFQSGFSTKGGGLGHGLHYCATSAMEMGWRVEAESSGPGKGSTFSVYIPIEELEEKAA